MKKIGIAYHPRIAASETLARKLEELLPSLKVTPWVSSSWEEENIRAQLDETDLMISIGGDGTILRLARAVAPTEIPILGVNLGHLGFTTELRTEDIMDRMPSIVGGEGWIDERAMLEVDLLPVGMNKPAHGPLYALNDVVVGRGSVSRVVYINTKIDGELLTTFKADGVIVSTATGSTGYNLACGGPVLYPQAEDILLKPISPHLTMATALVLPSKANIEMEVSTDHQAMLSIDGQVNLEIHSGDKVRVKRASYSAHFLRVRPKDFFYSTLEERLRGRK